MIISATRSYVRLKMKASFRRCIYVLILCMAGIILIENFFVAASNAAGAARLLYINSYHRGYIWSDGIEQGLRDRLGSSGRDIEISAEYLDSRRFIEGAHNESLARVIKIKYSRYHPDVVVVSDNAAFDFVMKYRNRLFPGIPVVFCGYNNFRPDVLKGLSNITGINEETSIEDNVNMALKVHPGVKNLAFILSTGEATSKRIKDVAEKTVFPEMSEKYNLVLIEDASIEEIRIRLSKLPANTLLFLCGQTRDQGYGRALTPEETGRLVSGVSPFPVYALGNFYLNTGVIGGHVLTGPDQGCAAADLVLAILNGTPADDLPVVMTSPAADIFDYRVMQRFGVSERQLPTGSRIINKPDTLYHKYKAYIWLGSSVVIILAAMVLVLSYQLRISRVLTMKLKSESEEKEKTAAELKNHKERLEDIVTERTTELRKTYEALHEREVLFHRMFDMHSAAMYLLNPDTGRIVEANQAALDFYGYTLSEIQAIDIYSINPMNRDEIDKKMQLTKRGEVKNYELQHRIASGEIRDIEIYTTPIPYKGEELLFAIVHDITDRKMVENEREALIAELKEVLSEVRILSGLLPICASCKKIRNDAGYWEQIEGYISKHSEAEFSHGLCPDCAEKLYPGLNKKK